MNTATVFRQYVQVGLGRVLGLVHHSLALVGLAAISIVLLQGARYLPSLPSPEKASGRHTSFGTIRYDTVSIFESNEMDNPKYRAIAAYLSRKYKVASAATEQLVVAAYDAGNQVGIDPLLLLAVIAIESRFNPIAESVMGAKGLMQVIPRHHQDKLSEHGGVEAVLEPTTNIQVGARILKDYARRTGSLEAALQLYSGGLSDSAGLYAQKVMAERDRLRQSTQRLGRPA